jgi:catalase
VRRVGRLTLDRNPEYFFAETEQVAFHPGHVVPGIDFSNDPLLQGRLFSYTDTQLLRLGGPNFHEIPINRPVAPVHNHQRDGFMRQTLNRGKANYEPNTTGGGCPMQAARAAGGFVSFPESMLGMKVRGRSEKFHDHFSQAKLFFDSQSEPEKDHIVEALRFELGKVERLPIRERMVGMLNRVDATLAARVAEGLGLLPNPKIDLPLNRSLPAGEDPKARQPRPIKNAVDRSEPLSMAGTVKDTIKTRRVAILAADGVDEPTLTRMVKALTSAGALAKIVGPRLGYVKGSEGREFLIDFSLLTASSVLFDAVYVPGGEASVRALAAERDAVEFVTEAYRHCKAIAATGEGAQLLAACPGIPTTDGDDADPAVVVGDNGRTGSVVKRFIDAIAQHRNWTRAGRNRLVSSGAGELRGEQAPV